jgi:uncharacterized protein YqgV (UPF0045/DUF77 family)
MIIQAEVSLYPLRTPDVSEAIDRFLDDLKEPHLEVTTGAMSTRVVGESKAIFQTMSRAFTGVSEDGQVVLVLKISNACPGTGER